jgi:hypothetical protein
MKPTQFMFNDGCKFQPMQGKQVLQFTFLDYDFEVVKVQKYFYILCEGVYVYANTNEYKTALELQMCFTEKCTRLKTSASDIRNFIDQRKNELIN